MRIIEFFFIFFISFLIVFFLGVNFNPDSTTYISNDRIRPPAYPLIINFFDYVFKKNSLSILVFFQVFCWLYASIYFSNFLCKILILKNYYKYFFLIFLTIPLNPVHQYGNTILAESFSFISCIFIFINIYNFYQYQNKKYAIYLFFILVFALTLRHQMIFLTFSTITFSFFLLIMSNLKKSLILFTVSILSLLSANFLNKSYVLLKYDQFEENKRIGLQLIVLPLFNISEESISKIENQKERKIITKMKESINNIDPFFNVDKKKNILPLRNINHFATSYNIIISYSIHPVLKESFPDLTYSQRDEKLINLAKIILKTSMKYEPVKTVKLYLNNFIRLGFSNFFWFLVCLVVLSFSILEFLKSKSSTIFLILFLSTTHFLNILLVSIFEPVLFRYSFYTNLTLCALVAGLCLKAIKNQRTEKLFN